jgi:hypothetical protein
MVMGSVSPVNSLGTVEVGNLMAGAKNAARSVPHTDECLSLVSLVNAGQCQEIYSRSYDSSLLKQEE